MTLNFKNPKTKDKIIFILKKTPKITTKQIYSKLKGLDWNYSYQSVHKILKELIDNEIILRTDNKYSLSKTWLNNLNNFLQLEKITKVEKIGNMMIHSFNSLSGLDKFLFEYGKTFDKNSGKNDVVYWEALHYWWPIAYSKEMYDVMIKREEKHKSTKVFLSKNPLDKWCANYYEKLGVEVKFKNSGKEYYAKYKNQSLEIILPDELKHRLNRFFQKVKSFEDIDLKKFYRTILNKKEKIKVIIT